MGTLLNDIQQFNNENPQQNIPRCNRSRLRKQPVVSLRPFGANHCQIGDWTQELFMLGLEQPRLPLWITAAQPSLMEKSIYYDNSKNTTYIYLTTPCLLLL